MAKSRQELNWIRFAARVAGHIHDYVIPQYGDEGEEPAKEYDARDCVKQAERYLARFGRNARGQQEELRDLLKAAHWVQKAYDRIAPAVQSRPLIFFREEGWYHVRARWYHVELKAGEDVMEHVRLNPGTKRVEDALTGEVLWEQSQ